MGTALQGILAVQEEATTKKTSATSPAIFLNVFSWSAISYNYKERGAMQMYFLSVQYHQ